MRSLIICLIVISSAFTATAQTVLCDYTISNTCQNDTVWFVDKSSVTPTNLKLAPVHIYFGDKDASGALIDAYMQAGGKVFHIYKTPGLYTVTGVATVDPASASNVPANTTNKSIQIFAQPALEIKYPEGKLIYTGQTKTIWAVADGVDNDKAKWSTGFIGKDLSVSKPGRYKVTVTDKNGCRNWALSDSIMVKDTVGIGYEIEVVNNVITPNSDGFDDYLMVNNIQTFAYPVILQVFNIWGQKVYETQDYRENYQKGDFWKAETVEAGTYYYVIRSKSKRGKTGYVDVIK